MFPRFDEPPLSDAADVQDVAAIPTHRPLAVGTERRVDGGQGCPHFEAAIRSLFRLQGAILENSSRATKMLSSEFARIFRTEPDFFPSPSAQKAAWEGSLTLSTRPALVTFDFEWR